MLDFTLCTLECRIQDILFWSQNCKCYLDVQSCISSSFSYFVSICSFLKINICGYCHKYHHWFFIKDSFFLVFITILLLICNDVTLKSCYLNVCLFALTHRVATNVPNDTFLIRLSKYYILFDLFGLGTLHKAKPSKYAAIKFQKFNYLCSSFVMMAYKDVSTAIFFQAYKIFP